MSSPNADREHGQKMILTPQRMIEPVIPADYSIAAGMGFGKRR
ncbi:MAG: hypothetical protein PHG00_12520 [Methylococcales bacterium]|nr:hypothetical protein [Methylococcales bacterium]